MKILVSLVSLLAILLVALPGPLYKFGLLELGPAFTAIRYGVYVGMGALALVVIEVIFFRKNIRWSTTAVAAVLAIIAVALPINIMMKARSVPPIHDISTDLVNPPQFDAIVPLRKNAANPIAYGGDKVAALQRQAYPDITTQKYPQTPEQVFAAALSSVKDLGWEVVSADKTKGIIEATDTTLWFGFKDDVVIRIGSEGATSIADIRSLSRVGRSDLGKNADRIRTLIGKIKAELASS